MLKNTTDQIHHFYFVVELHIIDVKTIGNNKENMLTGDFLIECKIDDVEKNMTYEIDHDKRIYTSNASCTFNVNYYNKDRLKFKRKKIRLKFNKNNKNIGCINIHMNPVMDINPIEHTSTYTINRETVSKITMLTRIGYEYIADCKTDTWKEDLKLLDRYSDTYIGNRLKYKQNDFIPDHKSNENFTYTLVDMTKPTKKTKWEEKHLEFDKIFGLECDSHYDRNEQEEKKLTDEINKIIGVDYDGDERSPIDYYTKTFELIDFFEGFQKKIKRFLHNIGDRIIDFNRYNLIKDIFKIENGFHGQTPLLSIFMVKLIDGLVSNDDDDMMIVVINELLRKINEVDVYQIKLHWYLINSYQIIYTTIKSYRHNDLSNNIEIKLNWRFVEPRIIKTKPLINRLLVLIKAAIKYWYSVVLKKPITGIRSCVTPFSYKQIISVFDSNYVSLRSGNISQTLIRTFFRHLLDEFNRWLFIDVITQNYNREKCISLKSNLSLVEEYFCDIGFDDIFDALDQSSQLCNIIIAGPENVNSSMRKTSVKLIDDCYFDLLVHERTDKIVQKIKFPREPIYLSFKKHDVNVYEQFTELKSSFKSAIKSIQVSKTINTDEKKEKIESSNHHDIIVSLCMYVNK